MLKFKKISIEDKTRYLTSYSNFPPYADYYFNNLFTWLGKEESVYVAYHREALALKFVNPFKTEDSASYTLLARGNAQIIMKYMHQNGVKKLDMVPKTSLESFNIPNSSGLSLDRDNSDYIYDAHSIAHMLGPKSKGFLRQVNKFIKRHSDNVLIRSIDLKDRYQARNFVNQIHLWEALYTKNDLKQSEASALDTYILLADYLEPECLGIYIDGRLQAFSIYSYPPQKGFMILSHAKSSYSHPGLFDFLVYSALTRAIAEKNIKYLNFEQDLGIEGLRTHKLSMRPAYLLEKYSVDLESLLSPTSGHKKSPTIVPSATGNV